MRWCGRQISDDGCLAATLWSIHQEVKREGYIQVILRRAADHSLTHYSCDAVPIPHGAMADVLQ